MLSAAHRPDVCALFRGVPLGAGLAGRMRTAASAGTRGRGDPERQAARWQAACRQHPLRA
jgi:hypothetical protein